MPKAPSPAIYEAITGFIARVGGIDVPVQAGDTAEAGSDIVRAYPDLFRPLRIRFAAELRIEQATAAPGEKRGE